MEDGLLSLKWNNHRTTFFHILSNLRKKQTYTDATIACEGKFFPVHKLVMSTCSDYFSEVFDKTSCKAPVVILKDIRHADLEALLDYMYLGEVDVKQSDLAGLIKAAECLRIKGLAVPDEDPSTPKKSSHVPDRQSTPPSKRRRRSSGLEDSHYSHKNHRSHSPHSSSRSHSSSTSVPSQSGDNVSHMPPFQDQRHSSKNTHEPEIVNVDLIKMEPEDDPEHSQQEQSNLLDHSSADDPGDDSSGLDGGPVDDLREKKDQLTNNFSDFVDTREIEKEEIEPLDPYSDSDQLAGPSGLQGGSSMPQWGEDDGSFHNLFGNEDPSQQQQVNEIANFQLPSFPTFAQPYLNGTASLSDPFLKPMRNMVINELIDALNAQKVLMSKNVMVQSWGSRRLQDKILLEYPNILREMSTRKKVYKGPLAMLVSLLMDRRRKKRNKKVSREFLNPELITFDYRDYEHFHHLTQSQTVDSQNPDSYTDDR